MYAERQAVWWKIAKMKQTDRKICHVLELKEINVVKMTILTKAIWRFNSSLSNNQWLFFNELGLIILQFIWGEKRPRRSKAVVERNVELEESTFLTSDYTTKTLWYRHKNRNIEQWNKTQSWEINPHSYRHLFFDKGGKNVQWRKDRKESLFSKWCWETEQLHVKEWN